MQPQSPNEDDPRFPDQECGTDADDSAIDRALEASKKLDLEERWAQAIETAKSHARDPLDGMDNPGYVIRCMILDVQKLYFALTGRRAMRIGITPAMEALLSTRDPDIKKMIEKQGKLRTWPMIFGCVPAWGVPDFYLG